MSNSGFTAQLNLTATGITAGTYGNSSNPTQFTVNSNGFLVAANTLSFTSINGAAVAGFKNVINNGAMQIWQRGTSFGTTAGSFPAFYTSDRWGVQCNSANQIQVIQQTSGNPTGFQNSLKIGRPSGNTATGFTLLAQVIETANAIPLQGSTVTLSYYAKAGANYSGAPGGTTNGLNVALAYGTGTDDSLQNLINGAWSGQTNIIGTNIALTTSFQRFQHTVTLPAGATQLGVQYAFTPVSTAGADDNVYITGVQLEMGSTATPFELRHFSEELKLCQRYFEKSFNIATAPANNIGTNTGENHFIAGFAGTTPFNVWWIPFKVTKRTTTPSITTYNPNATGNAGSAYNYTSGTTLTTNATQFNNQCQQGYKIIAPGNPATAQGHHLGVHWTASSDF